MWADRQRRLWWIVAATTLAPFVCHADAVTETDLDSFRVNVIWLLHPSTRFSNRLHHTMIYMLEPPDPDRVHLIFRRFASEFLDTVRICVCRYVRLIRLRPSEVIRCDCVCGITRTSMVMIWMWTMTTTTPLSPVAVAVCDVSWGSCVVAGYAERPTAENRSVDEADAAGMVHIDGSAADVILNRQHCWCRYSYHSPGRHSSLVAQFAWTVHPPSWGMWLCVTQEFCLQIMYTVKQ